MVTPRWSIVVATFDRGALIETTLQSIAQQTVGDFEVLVVSDGPAAAGLADTVAQFDERFRLIERRSRCGSQFGPNNDGWSVAAGEFIAYLGHDDVWMPSHLAELGAAFVARPSATFAASGCIYFGPVGAGPGHAWVTGMFDPDDGAAPRRHFFPPSSVAHRRVLRDDLRWPDAHHCRRAVDSQFLLSAAERRHEFTATGAVTVLKFNSAFRYLSYLCPDDDEQRAALDLIATPGELALRIERELADARTADRFMVTYHAPEGTTKRGEPVRRHARIRGIDTPRVRRLRRPTVVPVTDDECAFDWYPLERDGRRVWRWSGPNTRPRLLVPFTHPEPVLVSLQFDASAADDVRESIEVVLDRVPVSATVRLVDGGPSFVVEFCSLLRADRPSVIELRTTRTVSPADVVPGSADRRQLGLCLTALHLTPSP